MGHARGARNLATPTVMDLIGRAGAGEDGVDLTPEKEQVPPDASLVFRRLLPGGSGRPPPRAPQEIY